MEHATMHTAYRVSLGRSQGGLANSVEQADTQLIQNARELVYGFRVSLNIEEHL